MRGNSTNGQQWKKKASIRILEEKIWTIEETLRGLKRS